MMRDQEASFSPPAAAAESAPVMSVRKLGAAKITGLSVGMIEKLTRENRIPYARIGRAIVYPVAALQAWLEAQTKNGGAS